PVDSRPDERHLREVSRETRRAHAVAEARVVIVAEVGQDPLGAVAARAAGGAKAARADAGRALESVGRAAGALGLALGRKIGPGLVRPAVHADLVTAPHELQDRLRVMLAVPAFDEERRADTPALQGIQHARIPDRERRIGTCRPRPGELAAAD